MSVDQPKQTVINEAPPPVFPGNGAPNHQHSDEAALPYLYEEITGVSESQARSVFMFVIHDDEESTYLPPRWNASDTSQLSPTLV
jgi:hypothetical protein